MKFLFIAILLVISTAGVRAQSKDSVPVKSIIENGAGGDLLLGKENQRKKLHSSPGVLRKDSLQKTTTILSKKKKNKCKNRTSKR